MSDLTNDERAELERLRARNTELEGELSRWKLQSDAWQTRGWEAGGRLDSAVEHLENLMGHLDTPIARRKLGIAPDTDWLRAARAFCDSYGDSHEIGVPEMNAQRAQVIAELAQSIRDLIGPALPADWNAKEHEILAAVDRIDETLRLEPEDTDTLQDGIEALTRQRTKRMVEIIRDLRNGLDQPVADTSYVLAHLHDLIEVLETKSEIPEIDEDGEPTVVVALGGGDIFELADALRSNSSQRERSNALHRLNGLLARGLDQQAEKGMTP